MITYMTSKFVSITFRVDVTGNDVERTPWQYCNINMGESGMNVIDELLNYNEINPYVDVEISKSDLSQIIGVCQNQ